MAGGYTKLLYRPRRRLRLRRRRYTVPLRKVGKSLDKATHSSLISKQSFMLTPYVGQGWGNNAHHAYSFAIQDIPDYASFQQVFDMYKIIKVVIRFQPSFDSNDTSGANYAAGTPPTYLQSALVNASYRVCFDYDDAVVYTSQNDYLQNDTCVSFPAFGRGKTVTLYPKMKMDANNATAVSTSPKWIDFDTVDTPHYGLKVFQPVTNTVANFTEMSITCTMYFACKNRQ